MNSYFPAKGCVYAHRRSGTSKGFFALNPAIGSSDDSPVLIQGADLQDEDIVSPVAALNGYKILYTFGPGFGSVRVQGIVLLGNAQQGNGQGYASLISYFQKHRTAESKRPVSVSLPGKRAYKIFLSSLALGQVDQQFHVASFMIGGHIADLPS